MSAHVVGFVPMKADNARLPRKHFLPLAGAPLYTHVFRALCAVDGLDAVYAWASDRSFADDLPDDVTFLERDARFDGNEVRGLDLFQGFAAEIEADYYLLAHATAPFLRADTMQRGLDGVLSGDYDSAFSAEKIQTYCWYRQKPVNYDPTDMVRTQDLEPVYIETSGFYVYSRDEIMQRRRRIGNNPLIVEISDAEAIDIDWPADYDTARRFEDLLE